MLSPTVPLRSDAEKNALLNVIKGLEVVHEMQQLIPPRIVASNVTSQFRLLILDGGVVEIQRSGWGWGRERTVAAVSFGEETEFRLFMEMGSFSEVKKYLAQSLLQEKEVVIRGDSQVQANPPSESSVAII